MLAFHAGDRLLADVLPPGVAGFAIRGEEGDGGSGETTDLLPGEETALGQVCAIRRCQFAAGRRCGRRALAALDRAPEAILVGPGGEPRWPVGVIGSITHCCGYAAAIAMTAGVPAGIGIDVEPHQPISSRMLAHVASPSEHGWIAGAYDLGVHFDRLLFSVKESIYKAWFPLTSSRLRFADVRVTFQPADRCWRARLMVPGPTVHGEAILGFEGRYAVDDGFVLSFAASKTYVEKRTSRGIVSWVRKPTSGFEHNGGCDG